MRHYEFGWKSPSGKAIYAQGWEPENKKPRAIVLLIHGLGEHSGRYEHVAEFFCKKQIALLANDRIGHGKSKGARGHVPKYDQLLDDIVKLHSEASRKHPGVPVFLYGHSMGGGIALTYILRNRKNGLHGIISSGAALKLAFEPSPFKVFLGKTMRSIFGAFSQTNDLNADHISRDKAIVEAYNKDPLVHNKISAETGMGLLQWGRDALDQVAKVEIPMLIMHGGADQLTAPEGSKLFAEKALAAKSDVTLKIWDNLYHEIHNEPEKNEVLDYIEDWIQSKINN